MILLVFYWLLGWFVTSTLASYTLWDRFVFVMGLKRVRDAQQLNDLIEVLGWPKVILGFALDVYVNLFVCTFVLMELPRWGEWTVSQRIWRLSNGPSGYRQWLSLLVRVKLLDPFDPEGVHRG